MDNAHNQKNKRIGQSPSRMIARILIAAVAVAVLLILAFVISALSGAGRLRNKASAASLITLGEEMPDALPPEEAGGLEEGDIRYKGKTYRYNKDAMTFLIMGIDKTEKAAPAEDSISGGQSDLLMLAVLDGKNGRVKAININRDTMAEVDRYTKEGKHYGTQRMQITIQHAYGDGMEQSCERTVKAVQRLFYNIPINGYAAINMGAVPYLNDAIGGVEVAMEEDLTDINKEWVKGFAVTLTGKDAYDFVHYRDINKAESAAARAGRQTQYMAAYAGKAKTLMKKDPLLPLNILKIINGYTVTDLKADELAYLAAEAAKYSFSQASVYKLAGETRLGEGYADGPHEEFYPDKTAFHELMLEVFYEELGEAPVDAR